jgi:hypothetical protein
MSLIPQWLHWLASPPNFYRFADRLQPWLTAATAALLGYGLVGGLALAPPWRGLLRLRRGFCFEDGRRAVAERAPPPS